MWRIDRAFCIPTLIFLLFAGTASAYTQAYYLSNSSFQSPDGTVLPLIGSFVLADGYRPCLFSLFRQTTNNLQHTN